MSELSVDLATIIAKSMINKYKINREITRRDYEKNGKEVCFAYELTSCFKKHEYERQLSEISLQVSFKPPVIIGEIIEAGLEEYLHELNLVKPQRFWQKELDKYIIIGSPDYVDNEDNPRTVVDVKYSSSEPTLKEHHADRIKVYLWLTNAETGIVLYISPYGIKSYYIYEPFSDDEVKKRIELQKSPMYDWECRFCEYSIFCTLARIGSGDKNASNK